MIIGIIQAQCVYDPHVLWQHTAPCHFAYHDDTTIKCLSNNTVYNMASVIYNLHNITDARQNWVKDSEKKAKLQISPLFKQHRKHHGLSIPDISEFQGQRLTCTNLRGYRINEWGRIDWYIHLNNLSAPSTLSATRGSRRSMTGLQGGFILVDVANKVDGNLLKSSTAI